MLLGLQQGRRLVGPGCVDLRDGRRLSSLLRRPADSDLREDCQRKGGSAPGSPEFPPYLGQIPVALLERVERSAEESAPSRFDEKIRQPEERRGRHQEPSVVRQHRLDLHLPAKGTVCSGRRPPLRPLCMFRLFCSGGAESEGCAPMHGFFLSCCGSFLSLARADYAGLVLAWRAGTTLRGPLPPRRRPRRHPALRGGGKGGGRQLDHQRGEPASRHVRRVLEMFSVSGVGWPHGASLAFSVSFFLSMFSLE